MLRKKKGLLAALLLSAVFILVSETVSTPSLDISGERQKDEQAVGYMDDRVAQDEADQDVEIAFDEQEDDYEDEDYDDEYDDEDEDFESGIISPRTITDIIIHGNDNVTTEAILNKVPYHIGQEFNALRAASLIKYIMSTGFFRNVRVFGEPVADDKIKIHVIVDEKMLLKEMRFEGNKNLQLKEIKKKGFDPEEVLAIDEADLQKFVQIVRKLYREKNYHNPTIEATLTEEDGKLVANFFIDEGKRSIVKRVNFEGNRAFSDKVLRGKVFTREDWALSFMDKSGTYQPDALESDRHMLEDFYQSYGFLNAKVTDVRVDHEEGASYVNITFCVDEGDVYRISEVSVPGNDIMPEEEILKRLPIQVGDLYSKENIRKAIEALRLIWGEHGYVDADIEPSIEPDDDTKTVGLAFYSELGSKVYVNRINIIGNRKTRDKIIRRQLRFEEGDLLTTERMEESKDRVESLGFFEQRDGVSWKLKRRDKENVDLDLFVDEVKTGRFDLQLGFGGAPKDIQKFQDNFRIQGTFSETNLMGLGIATHLSGEFSKTEQQMTFNLTEPWLFDRPIYTAFDATLRRTNYDDFQFTQKDIKERLKMASLSVGFVSQSLNFTKMIGILGFEGISFNERPVVGNEIIDPKERIEFQQILNKRFPEGNFPYLGGQAGQDFRNHPMHPSRGYQWLFNTKLGMPGTKTRAVNELTPEQFGYWRFDFDASYFTPLIGERDLVLYLHAHFGAITAFKGKDIPYRELFNVGGPASVRGFLFGDIGPSYRGVDPLGGTKAFWLNAELIFPIAPDFSIKGAFFYDGGAGWATPDAAIISPKRLINNNFDYRHAVGFGVRILRPTPIKIDWGFKLDKRKGERESEVHLTMSRDF